MKQRNSVKIYRNEQPVFFDYETPLNGKEALKDSELKERQLKGYIAILDGLINEDDESSNNGWRRWDGYEIADHDQEEKEYENEHEDEERYHDQEEKEYENEHEDEERCELFDDHELPVFTIRRFEMIKYSFGNDEEYVAIIEYEYEGTDISKYHKKPVKNGQARTRESEEYKKKPKNQSRSQKCQASMVASVGEWWWWKMARERECTWGSDRSAHEEPFWSSPDGEWWPAAGEWWPDNWGRRREHPSETIVFHNEDGNPARANIKQALGYFKDGDGDGNSLPHKGVKASANSDVMYSFTSAQDGNPLQDDVRLCLGDDLKKAQEHCQRQAGDLP
ncbi:hypothetical protein Tco_1338662 [Tanacetum coccineum]